MSWWNDWFGDWFGNNTTPQVPDMGPAFEAEARKWDEERAAAQAQVDRNIADSPFMDSERFPPSQNVDDRRGEDWWPSKESDYYPDRQAEQEWLDNPAPLPDSFKHLENMENVPPLEYGPEGTESVPDAAVSQGAGSDPYGWGFADSSWGGDWTNASWDSGGDWSDWSSDSWGGDWSGDSWASDWGGGDYWY